MAVVPRVFPFAVNLTTSAPCIAADFRDAIRFLRHVAVGYAIARTTPPSTRSAAPVVADA